MAPQADSRCRQRNHAWDHGPREGSRCTRKNCTVPGGKLYGQDVRKAMPRTSNIRGGEATTGSAIPPRLAAGPNIPHRGENAAPAAAREPRLPKTAPTAVGADAAAGAPASALERLKQRWQGPAAPPANDNATPAATSTETTTVKADSATIGKLVDVVGPLAPQLFVGAAAIVVGWFGRIPKEPESEWVQKLQESTDILIRQHLPNVELGPWSGVGIFGGMTVLSMVLGSEKVPAKALPPAPAKTPQQTTTDKPASAPTPATVADSSISDTTTAPPPPANDNGADGSVKNAQDGPPAAAEETAFAGNAT